MKYQKLHKPGTTKTQLVEVDRVDFYRQYGWEPVIEEVTAELKPRKKTVKAEPAVEDTSSQEEVGTQDDNKGD